MIKKINKKKYLFISVVTEIDFHLNLKFRHGNFWEFYLEFKFRYDLQYLKLKFNQVGISDMKLSEIKLSEF